MILTTGTDKEERNMKKYSLLIAFALLLPLSCQRETDSPEENNVPKKKVTYMLTGILSERTKAFIADDGKFSWTVEDQVKVLEANSGELFTFTCTKIDEQGNGVFTFEGEEGADYSFTKAWYPASMASLDEDGEAVITLPGTWTAAEASESKNFPMAAVVSENQMNFFHLGGLLKLTINEVPKNATSIILSSDVAVNGDFSIEEIGLNDGMINVTGENVIVENDEIPVKSIQEIVPGETPSSVTVTDLNLESKGTITAYIPLPCGSYNYQIALKVDDESVFEKGTTAAKEIGRAHLIRMKAFSPWPATSLKAQYGSTSVNFVPSDLWGWYVAPGLPADQNILIDDSGTKYGTRFATRKHTGYFCQCFTGGTSGAFPLEQESDLYISVDKKKIFPLAAGSTGADVKLPEEYEVAHYGLRGDFAGTIGNYTNAGTFSKTDDSPVDGGNWKWYVVRNVSCTGTPIAFKLYGTPFKAVDGVLETSTETPQIVGVGRSLSWPGSGTSAVKYNVTPGMSYDVYLKEDLTQVIVCEAGSFNSSFDEQYLTGLTHYGLYNYNGSSYVCTPGIDQTWAVTGASSTTFFLAKGFTFDQVQFSGLPQKDTTPSVSQSVEVSICVTPSIGSDSNSTVTAEIVKIEGNKLWLLSEDGTGIIADYKR